MKLSKELNFICFILLFCLVNSQNQHQQQQQQIQHQQRHHSRKIQQQTKVKRIYALCPPGFTKIGNECYYLSSTQASWLDSHFECKDKNAKLAELLKYSDRQIRKYLVSRGRTRGEIWIGGMFDWSKNRWSWGYNGRDMTYQSFSQMKPGEDLKYHCAVLNPELKYRWSAKLCFEKHYYLCQHRMPYVSEKNRQRIYTRWNETFPGQKAEEIEVYVKPNGGAGNRRELNVNSRRPISQQQRTSHKSRDQSAQLSKNQIPVGNRRRMNNEINPPEVLSTQNTQLRRKKQPNNKSKERTLNLSGNVDLGLTKKSFLRKKNSKSSTTKMPKIVATTTTTTSTTTEHPNEIPTYYQQPSPPPSSNHHRHNHNTEYNRNEFYRRVMTSSTTTTQFPIAYQLPSSPSVTNAAPKSHSQFSSTILTPTTSPSETSAKLIEKKKRLENIREKLSKLSDEERIEFMRLKAQRKAQRSKSINETIP